jgi:hypothetical protein
LSKPALIPEILYNESENNETKIGKRVNNKLETASDESSDESIFDNADNDDSEEESEKESKFVNSARPKNETTEERKVFHK